MTEQIRDENRARATRCKDVLFFGARGSSQKMSDASGFGEQVDMVRERLAASLDSMVVPRSMESRALNDQDYPATAVSQIGNPRIGLSGYLRGIHQGATNGVTRLIEAASVCAKQRFVLAGYSQGAMVMHEILTRLGAEARLHHILRRVDGAVLLADGYRPKNTDAHLVGDPLARRGNDGIGLSSTDDKTPGEVPRSVQGVTWSVCTAEDVVCDFRGFTVRSIRTGASVHLGSSYKSGAHLTRVNRAVRVTVHRTPKVIATSLSVAGRAGESLSATLRADIDPDFRVEWRPDGQVPGGLTLNSRGQITGTPISPGMFAIPVSYRGNVLGVAGAWQNAVLRLSIAEGAASPGGPEVVTEGIKLVRPAGPAGTRTIVEIPGCPPARTPGATMYALGYTRELMTGAYHDVPAGYQGPVRVRIRSDWDLQPGLHPASVRCTEGDAAGNTIRVARVYSFTQNVTEPGHRFAIQPIRPKAGAPLTISDGGGCGNQGVPQTVTFGVHNWGGPVVPLGSGQVESDAAGRWGPVTIDLPAYAADTIEIIGACSNAYDETGFDYKISVFGQYISPSR